MHYHNCAVCGQQVSVCSDEMPSGQTMVPACQASSDHPNYGPAYCSLHHPDPNFRVEQAPPPPRYAVLVKEQSDSK